MNGRNARKNRQTKNSLCKRCNGYTKLIKTQLHIGLARNYVRIGRVCLDCNSITVDPRFKVIGSEQVIPRLEVPA